MCILAFISHTLWIEAVYCVLKFYKGFFALSFVDEWDRANSKIARRNAENSGLSYFFFLQLQREFSYTLSKWLVDWLLGKSKPTWKEFIFRVNTNENWKGWRKKTKIWGKVYCWKIRVSHADRKKWRFTPDWLIEFCQNCPEAIFSSFQKFSLFHYYLILWCQSKINLL